MANRNIFKALANPEHKPGRNAFDHSHRKIFTAKAGELLPVLCKDVVPGDYFEIDTATLLRTLPLNTAAFLRAKMNFDFFFVPKNILWHNWESFRWQRKDVYSSVAQGFKNVPQVRYSTLDAWASVERSGDTSPVNSVPARKKLLNLLGYGNLAKGTPIGVDGQRSFEVLTIAAYNHIYNDFYRNPWRDEPDSNSIMNMNFDDVACTSFDTCLIDTSRTSDFVKMHYRGWKKDLFMGSLPNQQFGSVSSISSPGQLQGVILQSSPAVNGSAQAAYHTNFSDNIARSGTLGVGDSSTGSSVWNIFRPGSSPQNFSAAGFDVLQLRRALALQKWKEYNMRAGYRAHNQQRAMFGVSPKYSNDDHVHFIDSYDASISIDEVVSQNGSVDGNLGELGGKGIGFANGKKIRFDVSDDGFIFCIFSIVPEAEYDAYGIDKNRIRSEAFDYYTPAFENLGMEAIHRYELNGLVGQNSSTADAVIGYAPRYYEYKTDYDKVYCDFVTGGALSSWVSTRRDLESISNSGTIPIESYYINPRVLDSVFGFNADRNLDTDQFLINLNFGISAIRPMSVLGLPSF